MITFINKLLEKWEFEKEQREFNLEKKRSQLYCTHLYEYVGKTYDGAHYEHIAICCKCEKEISNWKESNINTQVEASRMMNKVKVED